MPTHDYRCPAGHTARDVYQRLADPVQATRTMRCPDPDCNLFAVKVIAMPGVKRSFAEHMNTATGKYTQTAAEHRENLKRASEKATLRTGIEHNYVPMDHADLKPPDYEG